MGSPNLFKNMNVKSLKLEYAAIEMIKWMKNNKTDKNTM